MPKIDTPPYPLPTAEPTAPRTIEAMGMSFGN